MTLRKSRNICYTGLFFILWMSSTSGLDVPGLKGRVNDHGNMLSSSTEAQLEAVLKDLEQTDSTQIVVLTIPSLEGDSIEDFSIRVADKWKIGQEKKDNGAILIISKNDRALRIEVGYGLEGKLTDLVSGRIIQYVIVPCFKRGDFDGGVISGIQAMIQAVRGEFKADQIPAGSGQKPAPGSGLFPILIILFLVNMMGRIKRPLGAVAGGILFPVIGAMLFGPGLLMLLMIPVGVIAGLLLSYFGRNLSFNTPPGSGRNKNNYWKSGGGFGGFGGGGFGGGGFGGFSGGGGGFGGGGASGRW